MESLGMTWRGGSSRDDVARTSPERLPRQPRRRQRGVRAPRLLLLSQFAQFASSVELGLARYEGADGVARLVSQLERRYVGATDETAAAERRLGLGEAAVTTVTADTDAASPIIADSDAAGNNDNNNNNNNNNNNKVLVEQDLGANEVAAAAQVTCAVLFPRRSSGGRRHVDSGQQQAAGEHTMCHRGRGAAGPPALLWHPMTPYDTL